MLRARSQRHTVHGPRAFNSLFKAECIEIVPVPPAELEADHWASVTSEHYPETPVPAGAGSK